jgi:hypothetical protein
MVAFLGFYAAAELSHFVEIVPRVPVSAVKWKKFGKMGFRIQGVWSVDEHVAEWIVARERDTGIVSNFHIFERMPLSCMC